MSDLPIYIYGDSCDDPGRSFMIRTRKPRFIAEIFDDETKPPHGGLSLAIDDSQTLGNFVWLDSQPDKQCLVKLGKEISAALAEYDFRADRRGETLNKIDEEFSE